MNTKDICFLILSLFFVICAANAKIEEAFVQCMQQYDSMNARMACARIMLSLNVDEKRSESDESDSECIKKCKESIAVTIAHLKSSVREEETLFPTAKLLHSEKRAKFLKEQFLQCMKQCGKN